MCIIRNPLEFYMIYTLQQRYPSFFWSTIPIKSSCFLKKALCASYLNILPSKDKFKIDYLKNVLIFSFRVNCPEHDCSSHDMTTHFRRGQSKVYYASEVWDPGEDEEFARTSFRSGSGSEHSETLESYCNNDDFVASLMRRTSVEKSMYRYVKWVRD